MLEDYIFILAENQYYILEIALLYLCAHDEIVEREDTVRIKYSGNKFVAKTRDGLVNVSFMSAFPKYTHSEMIDEMKKAAWNPIPPIEE